MKRERTEGGAADGVSRRRNTRQGRADRPQPNQGVAEPAGGAGQTVSGTPMEFSFNGRVVRTIFKDGATWFIAADVCAALNLTNRSQALAQLDPDEKGICIGDTLGGVQELCVVNESGLYHLVFKSRKPEARSFRRWVTGEVLPSIRKTGRYDPGAAAEVPRLDGAGGGTRRVELPDFGRFIVTVRPDGIHIHQTEYELYRSLEHDVNATDCRILSHMLMTIVGFWHRTEQIRATGEPTEGGLSLAGLESAILGGGRLATSYLKLYNGS